MPNALRDKRKARRSDDILGREIDRPEFDSMGRDPLEQGRLDRRLDQMLSSIESRYRLDPGQVLAARKMLQVGDDDYGNMREGYNPGISKGNPTASGVDVSRTQGADPLLQYYETLVSKIASGGMDYGPQGANPYGRDGTYGGPDFYDRYSGADSDGFSYNPAPSEPAGYPARRRR